MEKSNTQQRILVMDDDRDILDAMKMVLEFNGYKVETCTNDQRLDFSNPPDLFLLDIWMSGLSGSDVCKRLKRNAHTKNIPVIIFSANRNVKEISEECNADGYIAKPFNLNQLLAIIAHHINNRKYTGSKEAGAINMVNAAVQVNQQF
jgi:DNA-binding response OmpR family regulator